MEKWKKHNSPNYLWHYVMFVEHNFSNAMDFDLVPSSGQLPNVSNTLVYYLIPADFHQLLLYFLFIANEQWLTL